MKEKYEIAIIGFSLKIHEEIKNLIKRTKLPLDIVYEEIKDDFSEYVNNLDRECDIIILNTIGFKTPMADIISSLRRDSPLTEIISVVFRPSSSLIIRAFRLGVRDVLEYPVRSFELKKALEQALYYRSLFSMSTLLSSTLTVVNEFGNNREFKSKEDFISALDRFFAKKYFARSGKIITISPEKRELVFENETYRLEDANKGYATIGLNGAYINLIYLGRYDSAECWYSYEADVEMTLVEDFISLRPLLKIIQNAFQYQVTQDENIELSSLRYKDDVTDLFNQRKLHSDLDTLANNFQKNNVPFTALFLDIDNFKNVNDKHNHIVGSMILKELADVIKKTVRETDLIYRYGGDEFVLLLPNSDSKASLMIATRLLKSVEKQVFLKTHNLDYQITVSIGLAVFPNDAQTPNEVIEIADKMMYEAKKGGKNKIAKVMDFLK